MLNMLRRLCRQQSGQTMILAAAAMGAVVLIFILVISLAGLGVIIWMARVLLGTSAALIATGLWTFDAFLLAHTRILNTDPLL